MAGRKEDELDEDSSYRQFFVHWAFFTGSFPPRMNLLMHHPRYFHLVIEAKKKLAVLPMSLPPVEEINLRWKVLEGKAEGNPLSEDANKLYSTPFNSDRFLPYS